MIEVQHILSINNQLGEGPIWSVQQQALYWCDILTHHLFTYRPTTGEVQTFALSAQPGCLALVDDGSLLLATAKGFAFYDFDKLTFLDDNIAYMPPARFNDGKVDRQGRFWAGTALFRPEGHLYRLDTDGKVTLMERGISVSNGIGWSPDNGTMYYSDSGGTGVVYAYDFDSATGDIANRRIFLPPSETGGVADGLTVDSEGGVWCAYWDGWRVVRYAPDGTAVLTIPMPVQRPTSCNFGGPDLTTLYITSSGEGMDRSQQPWAGDLFCVHTEIKGLPEPTFKRRF